jgi:hypothetical protein
MDSVSSIGYCSSPQLAKTVSDCIFCYPSFSRPLINTQWWSTWSRILVRKVLHVI